MRIKFLHPHGIDLVGYIPEFLFESDDRPAREQFNERYAHGGGWSPFNGFAVSDDATLEYPGDPAIKPVARIAFRDEEIFIYPYAWVMIRQPNGSTEVARMD